jgi:predicted metal-dependent hydrolase
MDATKESRQFLTGVELFNARKFFQAHEVWEELWLAELEPEKSFLQGLIQLAAACHHQGRGNPSGARSLATTGLAKLARFPDDHRGIAVAELRSDADKWLETLGGEGDSGAQTVPRIRLVARFSRENEPGR